MAARIGLSLATLRKLDPTVCDTDARLVWKDGDEFNIGIVNGCIAGEGRFVQGIFVSSTRDLRLLGMQMIRHADNLDREPDGIEVVIP